MTNHNASHGEGLNGAVAAVLRGELRAQGLRQKDLAERTGIPEVTIQRLLAGKRGIGVSAMGAMAAALDIPLPEVSMRAIARLEEGGGNPGKVIDGITA